MKMKVYREDQKYHDQVVIGLAAILVFLLLFTLATESPTVLKISLGLATVAFLVFLGFTLRLKIRISPKKMSIRIAPLPWTRLNVSRDDVASVEFISSDEMKAADGWNVHYGGALRIFDFGDRGGMLVHRVNGEDVVILSRRLFEQRSNVLDQLASNGWNLS